jgi:hypothetical protein
MEKKAPKLPQVDFSVPVLRKSKVLLDKSTLQDLEAVQRACSDVLHEEQCLMQVCVCVVECNLLRCSLL